MKKKGIIIVCVLCLLFTGLFTGAGPVAAATSVTASNGSASSVQSAINTVQSTGGGTVYIPAGTFNLGGSVTVPANVSLIGAGAGKTVLRTSGPFKDLPEEWTCPICGAGKKMFRPLG